MQVAIYLAGKIQKGHESVDETYWSVTDLLTIEKALSPIKVSFLNPAVRADDLTNQESVFGRDMLQVFSSDVVFVDARERRGLGVGAEMMWAKMNHIPVVSLAPAGTHYFKDKISCLGVDVVSWKHPFVECLSDAFVESLEEGADWIQRWKRGEALSVKGPQAMHDAMRYYVENSLKEDFPMQDLLNNHPSLRDKLDSPLSIY